MAKRRYANELRLFGGNARVTLEATFAGSNEELRVTFRSIRLVLFGNQIFEKQFPPGVERTWCLSYTDASCRVVRAGVESCVEIKILRCVLLNHRVLHAIDATRARWRGDAGSSLSEELLGAPDELVDFHTGRRR